MQTPVRSKRILRLPYTHIAALLAWALVGLLSSTVLRANEDIGAGTLLFQEGGSAPIEAPRLHTHVKMEISGVIARVEVVQRFSNPSDRWVEGLYAFPLPENSSVDQLRMEIGERIIVGEVREKQDAQKVYEQAREQGKRASVVHQHRPNLFRTAVANIGPHETIRIAISYLQIVDQQAGRYSLRFPLTITPRYTPGGFVGEQSVKTNDAPPPIASEHAAVNTSELSAGIDASDVLHPNLATGALKHQSASFDISLDAGVPVTAIESAYHEVRVSNDSGAYEIQLIDEAIVPDHDFQLAWTPVVHSEPSATVFRERTEHGEHLLLMFMPPQEPVALNTPRDLIFVIDTSGSMSGTSIEQARAALLKGLRTLQAQDTFNIVQFNSNYELLFPSSVSGSTEHLRQAHEYVQSLVANGGTEMYPALNAAMRMARSGEHLRQIVFITDGAVGNEDQLMQLIAQHLGEARLFTVGIGSAPNGHFMRKAAQMGRGTFTFIGSTDEVNTRMAELLHKLQHPALTNIELHWPGGMVPEYAPASIGDLYSGEPLVVSVRLTQASGGQLQITGQSLGVWSRQIDLNRTQPRSGVATLWARQRISDLMDLRASGVAEESIRAHVVPLALDYHLVSAFTSLVAVDHTPARLSGEPLTSKRLPNTKPQGLDWPTASYPQTATSADLQLLLGVLALLLASLLFVSRRNVQRS